jgi:hypothetical protein
LTEILSVRIRPDEVGGEPRFRCGYLLVDILNMVVDGCLEGARKVRRSLTFEQLDGVFENRIVNVIDLVKK